MINRVHLNHDGLEMFLGSLEAEVLRILWDHSDPLTTTSVHNTMIRNGSNAAYTTAHETLRRIEKKGLVKKAKRGEITTWAPVAASEDQFIAHCIVRLLDRLYAEHGYIAESIVTNIIAKGSTQ